MTTSSQCNTGRMCVRLPIITRENTSVSIHVFQKITIIRVQKIGKFAVWNLILCTGAIWRRIEKFEYRCTTTYHPYNKPPKHFWKLHGLIDFWCAQTLALPCAFGIPLQFDSFIVAPCNAVAKYFYTNAHLQYMGYWAVVEIFFHLASKWSKWCAQTLHPFSQIFKFYRAIRPPIVAHPSENFENCSIGWKELLLLRDLRTFVFCLRNFVAFIIIILLAYFFLRKILRAFDWKPSANKCEKYKAAIQWQRIVYLSAYEMSFVNLLCKITLFDNLAVEKSVTE